MPKLRLKRTPTEEAERQLRKAQKAARRRRRQRHSSLDDHHRDHAHKRRHPHKSGHNDDDDVVLPGSCSCSNSSDQDSPRLPNSHVRSRYDSEEEKFRDKLSAAYEDDDRLFSLEERLNDYAHVPQRWRTGKGKGKRMAPSDGGDYDDDAMDPQYMSEEQYAEWVRAGMWRRKHAAEYEEQRQQQAQMDARRAREEAVKAETARLAQRAEDERRRKKREREASRWADAREEYDARWKVLSSTSGGERGMMDLKFEDVPWPIMVSTTTSKKKRSSQPPVVEVQDLLTESAISAFLLPPPPPDDRHAGETSGEAQRDWKERKERLRETMLRFHPDKFEGRLLKRVRESDREKVRDGVGQVARVLNALMMRENDTR